MSSNYRIGAGLGLTYGDLALIEPQPRSESRVQHIERKSAASGDLYLRGQFIVLQWSVLNGFEEYQLLLDQFDLEDFTSRSITGWFPDHEGIYRLYQGVAYRPENPRNNYFPRDAALTCSRLELI